MNYHGKICNKHPELRGERYKDGHCVGCAKEHGKQRYATASESTAVWKAWRKDNPEKARAARIRWRAANPKKVTLAKAKWRKANRDKINACDSAREARKLQATPTWNSEFDALVFAEAFALAKLRTKITGIKWHVDHAVPLRSKMVCGLHTGSNIQVIPARDNQSKSNRYWPNMP